MEIITILRTDRKEVLEL